MGIVLPGHYSNIVHAQVFEESQKIQAFTSLSKFVLLKNQVCV